MALRGVGGPVLEHDHGCRQDARKRDHAPGRLPSIGPHGTEEKEGPERRPVQGKAKEPSDELPSLEVRALLGGKVASRVLASVADEDTGEKLQDRRCCPPF